MSAELVLRTPRQLSGWVLVKAHLDPRYRDSYPSLGLRRRSSPGKVEEFPLPVMRDGQILELVELPDDAADLSWRPPENGQFDASQITVRRVGWFERTVRMADRVLRNWARLSRDERLTSGVSLWQAFVDLPAAYRIATRFRVRYSYADWIERFHAIENHDIGNIRAHIGQLTTKPHFHLLLTIDRGDWETARTTLASLRGQLFRNFTCSLLDTAGVLDFSFEADVRLLGLRPLPLLRRE